MDNAVPEELLVQDPLPDEIRLPGNMAPDIIPINFQVDIDRKPVVLAAQPPEAPERQPEDQDVPRLEGEGEEDI